MYDRNLFDPTVDSTPQQYRCYPADEDREGHLIPLLAGCLYGLIIGMAIGAALAWVLL